MTAARRPWWRKNRWRVAFAGVLLGLPLSLAPPTAAHMIYLAGRGDLPATATERLTLFRAWSAYGDSPAATYQRYLYQSYQAGWEERNLSAALREVEADLATIADPQVREQVEQGRRSLTKDRDFWRSMAPFIFR